VSDILPQNYRLMPAATTSTFIDYISSLPGYTDIFASPSSFIYLRRVSRDSAYDFNIVSAEEVRAERTRAAAVAAANEKNSKNNTNAGSQRSPRAGARPGQSPRAPPPAPGDAAAQNQDDSDAGKKQEDSEVYYTLSAYGLTCAHGDQTDFTSLPDFEREYCIYQQITSQPFFRQYHMWKGFIQWKNAVASRRISRACLVLQDDLFILHPDLRAALLKLRRYVT
jgi:hypothetical protein